MELKLQGFRCYENKTFTFPNKGIVLLEGESGAGKTTILQSITWCLYGKIRNVECNRNSKKKKMFVQWKMDKGCVCSKEVVIYRQKHPNLLKIRYGLLEMVDDVAQEKINNLFGTHSIWNLSSYIPQHQFNPLFTSSATGGLQYLNCIAFLEQDPSSYINKIQEEWKESKIRFDIKQKSFEEQCNEFKEYLSSNNIQKDKYCSEEDLSSKKENLKSLELDLTEKQKITRSYEKDLVSLQMLEKQEKSVSEHLKDVCSKHDYTFPIDLLSRSSIIESFECYISENKNLSRLQTKIDNIEDEIEEFSKKGIQEVEDKSLYYKYKKEKEPYSRLLKICKKYNIKVEISEIEQRIQYIQRMFNVLDVLGTYCKMMEIHDEVKNFPKHSEVSEEKMLGCQERILSLKQSLSTLKCPKCNISLRYHKGVLEKYKDEIEDEETSNTSLQEKLDAEIKHLEELRKKDKENKRREVLVNQFNHYKKLFLEERETLSEDEKNSLKEHSKKDFCLSQDNKKKLKQEQEDLKQVFYWGKDYVSEEGSLSFPSDLEIEQLKLGIEKKEKSQHLSRLEEEKQNLETKIQKLIELDDVSQMLKILKHEKDCPELETIDHKFQQFKKECILLKEQNTMKTHLDKELSKNKKEQEKLKNTSDKLEQSQEELDKLSKEITSLKQNIEDADLAIKAINKQKKLEIAREEIVEIAEKVKYLDMLKQIAVDTECQVLDNVVHHINNTVNTLSEDIFTNNINVQLKLYKELKTKKKITPKVNFIIRYKAGEFSSPQEISGGEQSRLSLLFTLALNRWNNSKFLLLDETFSSLDQEIKIECLRAIHKVIPQSLVLCVDHTNIEGHYDHVLSI